MDYTYTTSQAIEFSMLLLMIGREGINQSYPAKLGIGWSVRNRIARPEYWGHDWLSVIEKRASYTSMNPPSGKDVNLTKYPRLSDPHWQEVITAAEAVYWNTAPDPTAGATHYFDKSMDSDPPFWVNATGWKHTVDIDAIRFWQSA